MHAMEKLGNEEGGRAVEVHWQLCYAHIFNDWNERLHVEEWRRT